MLKILITFYISASTLFGTEHFQRECHKQDFPHRLGDCTEGDCLTPDDQSFIPLADISQGSDQKTSRSSSTGFTNSDKSSGSVTPPVGHAPPLLLQSDSPLNTEAPVGTIHAQYCLREVEEWLLYCAASHVAYPPCKREKFTKPVRPPAGYLSQRGYNPKKLSPYVTVCTNEEEKKAIFAICGTSCIYTLLTTVASFSYWNETQYDRTLSHFFPSFLSKPYSAAIYASLFFTAASFVLCGLTTYNQQYMVLSYSLSAITSVFFLVLRMNLFPSFFSSFYLLYVSEALNLIEGEKNKLSQQGFRHFTVTGHSLGGHTAQFVAAFDKELKVFSISAIGGAYPNACNAQAWFARSGKNRTLLDQDSWKKGIKGLIGEKDPVVGLSYDGDMKLTRVGEGDETPLSSHRLAGIYRAVYAIYAGLCIDAINPPSKQISPPQRPLGMPTATDSRLASVSPPPTLDKPLHADTRHPKKRSWKMWGWWSKSSSTSATLPTATPDRRSVWNLFGLIRPKMDAYRATLEVN